MRKIFIWAVAVVAFACGGSSTPAEQTVFNATLNGANETPANTSTATGTAKFTLTNGADGGVPTMNWTASSSPLAGTLSGFHIHIGDAGVPGPVYVTMTNSLTQAVDKGVDGGGSFTAVDATAPKNADGGTMTFDELVTAMRDGQTYVNIHDRPTYTGGEIRGQLGK
jgi:CHRD domain